MSKPYFINPDGSGGFRGNSDPLYNFKYKLFILLFGCIIYYPLNALGVFDKPERETLKTFTKVRLFHGRTCYLHESYSKDSKIIGKAEGIVGLQKTMARWNLIENKAGQVGWSDCLISSNLDYVPKSKRK